MEGIYRVLEGSEAPNSDGGERTEGKIENGEILKGGTSRNRESHYRQWLEGIVPRKSGRASAAIWLLRPVLRKCPKEYRACEDTSWLIL